MIHKRIEGLRHVFGPVKSRRLGLSLGVDLIPHKTCPLNCVYCECGDTTNLTDERAEYISAEEIVGELESVLSRNPALDYITYSGSGEPTLNSKIGWISDWIKSRHPGYKVCLITNGNLLGRKGMAEELRSLDLIIPSLDAADDAAYQRINRPRGGFKVAELIDGLAAFRRANPVEFWLEVFVVPGVNDSASSLAAFAEAVARIRPDKIQVNTLDRPGCVDWIRKASPEEVAPFVKIFSPIAPVNVV